jgi:hypothetical protein
MTGVTDAQDGPSTSSRRSGTGIEVDQADRRLIELAAAQLRQRGIRAAYAGFEHKHLGAASCLSDRVDLYEPDCSGR